MNKQLLLTLITSLYVFTFSFVSHAQSVPTLGCQPGWHHECAPHLAGGCNNPICVEDQNPPPREPCDHKAKFNLVCECHSTDNLSSENYQVISVKGSSWDDVRAKALHKCSKPSYLTSYILKNCMSWIEKCE